MSRRFKATIPVISRWHTPNKPVPVPRKRLYSVPEAATYLGRTVCAVRELIWKGQLSAVKCGRRIHLDIRELQAGRTPSRSTAILSR